MITSDVYSRKRYWYHLSSTLKNKYETLIPRKNNEGFNRNDTEPDTPRICVSPSLECCLVAIPYSEVTIYSLYKTRTMINVYRPSADDIFDANVTKEGWLLEPSDFVRTGYIILEDILTPTGRRKNIRDQVATDGSEDLSRELYRWWKKCNPIKFLTKTPQSVLEIA